MLSIKEYLYSKKERTGDGGRRANFFPFRTDFFQQMGGKSVLTELFPVKVY